ncbi:hypothetical protein [Nocardia acidivorans]|uniref:hypothetical protein n=1 Tax=Nocardia acidivorans TaxID=404580 RepID=UPI000835AD4A|nr:hypothetical protein [Nocardia acidivorans]
MRNTTNQPVPSHPHPAPVTITHAFGETTLATVPKRIAALGNQWLDTAQSLGVTPIAYLNDLATPAVLLTVEELSALNRPTPLSLPHLLDRL